MKTSFFIAIVLFFLFSVSAMGQNSINAPIGKKVHSVSNSIATISQSVMGQEIEIKTDAIVTLDAEIKRISPDILLSFKITRVQVKSEAMGSNTEFDSDKSEDKNGQIGQLYSSVIDKLFDIQMTKNGRSIKTEKSNDAATEAVKSMIDNFDEMGGELLFAIPETIKTGSTWVDENITDAENSKKTEYLVLSANDNEAIISFKGTALAKINKNVQGMDALVSSSSSFSGEIIVDTKSGVIKSKKTIIEAKGTTEVMGQSIPFSSKQSTTSINN